MSMSYSDCVCTEFEPKDENKYDTELHDHLKNELDKQFKDRNALIDLIWQWGQDRFEAYEKPAALINKAIEQKIGNRNWYRNTI